MTDLTEQWKKGELKLGEHYYYTTIFSPTVHIQNFTRDVTSSQDFKETVAEVLAPVPSYNEYISLVNWKEDLTELCTIKERIIEKYENIDTWWKAEYTELKEENTKLKELLKRARGLMNYTKDWACSDATEEMITKINQVLGEE